MMMTLELSGFEVRRVSRGAEAVPAVAEFAPEAVVLDVGLPDIDGLSVYRQINAEFDSLPVVFATGHADETLLSEIKRLPHVQFLRKPFELDALIAAIEKATRGRGA